MKRRLLVRKAAYLPPLDEFPLVVVVLLWLKALLWLWLERGTEVEDGEMRKEERRRGLGVGLADAGFDVVDDAAVAGVVVECAREKEWC